MNACRARGWEAEQPLQCCAGVRLNAHTGVDREAAVLVGQHVFGLTTLQQAPADKGAQDATAQISLHLGHGRRINPAGWVEDHARRGCFVIDIGIGIGIGIGIARHLLKHPIDHAHMEMHMLVQAGSEAVDEGV